MFVIKKNPQVTGGGWVRRALRSMFLHYISDVGTDGSVYFAPDRNNQLKGSYFSIAISAASL